MIGKEDENLFRVMGAFGAGLGSNGEVCGAIVGALTVVGLRFGRVRETEEVDPRVYQYAREILRRFPEEIAHGKILCREIAEVDWLDVEQVKAFREGEKRRECARITSETARLVGEILQRR